MEQECEPHGEVVVAQAARTVLEVWLEVEDGVRVLLMAGTGNLAQLLGDGAPLAQNQTGQDGLVELLVERKLAGQKAAIERGECEFEIVRIKSSGFLERARG